MKKTSSITKKAAASHQRAFEEIVDLIEQSRLHAAKAVNTTLVDLYWNVGVFDVRNCVVIFGAPYSI